MSQLAVVPAMVALAIVYAFTLPRVIQHYPGRLEVILQALGIFNLILLAICAWFAWGTRNQKSEAGS